MSELKLQGNILLNHVYCMDCINLMRQMPDESVDLIIADPPYYRIHGDFDFQYPDEDSYVDWVMRWTKEAQRILKSTGAFYCWCSERMVDRLSLQVFDSFSWHRRNLIIWNYQTGRPSKRAYRIETELLWFYSKGEHLLNHDEIRIPYLSGGHESDKRKNPMGKSCGNVWINPRIMKNYPEWVDHPTQKPLALCDRIVKASSNKGDTVFIPFAGSGSEVVSAMRLQRNYIAAEINKDYVILCNDRINQAKGECFYECDSK